MREFRGELKKERVHATPEKASQTTHEHKDGKGPR
jgi:hypothetical protein